MSDISDAERRQLQTLRREKRESQIRMNQLSEMVDQIVKSSDRRDTANRVLKQRFGQKTTSLVQKIAQQPLSDWALKYSMLAILVPASGINFCLDLIGDLITKIKRIVFAIVQKVYDAIVWVSKKVWQGVCYVGSKVWQGVCWVGSKIKQFWNWIWN